MSAALTDPAGAERGAGPAASPPGSRTAGRRAAEWIGEAIPDSRYLYPVLLVPAAVLLLMGMWWLVLALAVVVPGIWLIEQRPQRGILLLVATLPFDGLRIPLGLPSWAGIWKEVIVAVLVVFSFTCPPESRGIPGRKLPGWIKMEIAIILLAVLSAVQVDLVTAITGLRISYWNVMLVAVIWRCPLTRRDRDQMVTVTLLVGFITAVVGIWQQIVGDVTLAKLGWKYNESIRFTAGHVRSFSTFNQPFPFSNYLMLVILLCLPFALAEPKRLRSKVFFVTAPVMMLGLFYSFTRSGWLGLAVGLLYLAFHKYKILLLGIPLLFVAALFIPTGTSFNKAAFSSSSLEARTTSWSENEHRLTQHPLGSGIGTTGASAAASIALGSKTVTVFFQPDNSYLKVVFELGVLGLWLFLLMLVSSLLYVRAAERRAEGPDRDFIASWTAQILAVMAASVVSTYFEMVPMDALFWIMNAAVAAIPLAAIAPERKPMHVRSSVRASAA